MVKIVTDSTSDIPAEIAEQLNVSVVPVIIEIDGATQLDGVTLTRRQFYANLEHYREIPRTAAPSPLEFAAIYRAAKASGVADIVSIHLNRKFSGLCAAVDVAAQEVKAEGVTVHVIDSESVTMGLGWLVITAAQMANQGAGVQAIVDRIMSLRRHMRVYALIDTLKYLRKGGRANALVAGIGDMLQIKVLINVHDGNIEQVDRIRTRARGIARLLDVAHSHRSVHHLSVLYTTTGAESDIANLQSQLCDLVPLDQQYKMQITPVIGSHVGPMALGLAMTVDV
ncbi:MAG: DegV family protein [Chloroflexi bacterium]|nr:DegV family protein [Chloroflexota bacterium]